MAAQYYLVLGFLLLTLLAMRRILNSLVGRTFRAIRGNEELAEAVGIQPMRIKILSFTTSCFFAGIGGVLYASYIGFLSPELTDYHVSFDSLVYIMIGGVGTMAGPIIGTLLFVTIPETLHVAAEYRLLVYGLILILMIIYLPRGIVGGIDKPEEKKDKGGSMSAILTVEGLSRFFGGLAAVMDLDFEVQAGEILSLIGPNGAGKTTVFNLITGTLLPTRGRLRFSKKRSPGCALMTRRPWASPAPFRPPRCSRMKRFLIP